MGGMGKGRETSLWACPHLTILLILFILSGLPALLTVSSHASLVRHSI